MSLVGLWNSGVLGTCGTSQVWGFLGIWIFLMGSAKCLCCSGKPYPFFWAVFLEHQLEGFLQNRLTHESSTEPKCCVFRGFCSCPRHKSPLCSGCPKAAATNWLHLSWSPLQTVFSQAPPAYSWESEESHPSSWLSTAQSAWQCFPLLTSPSPHFSHGDLLLYKEQSLSGKEARELSTSLLLLSPTCSKQVSCSGS